MAYKFRVILDVEEDVFRDILVDEKLCLEDLHYIIAKSFGFNGQEMASFYRANDTWEQGEEIPLFDMSEDGNALSMHNCIVKNMFQKKGDKLIYVYDFFSMWTFFVELSKIVTEPTNNLPKITLSFGNPPKEAPNKQFKSDEEEFDFLNDDDLFNDDENFKSFDDDNFDFDNY